MLNRCSSMLERHNKIQAIEEYTEKLNINSSITSILPKWSKPDLVIENDNRKYIVYIASTSIVKKIDNSNNRKREKLLF